MKWKSVSMLGVRVDDEIFLSMPLDQHAEPLFALVDSERDRINAWLSAWDNVHTVDDERRRLTSRRLALVNARDFGFVIEVDGEVAGTIGFRIDDDEPHTAAIGYMLSHRYEGRGIVTRALTVVIDAAIHRLGVHRFEIRSAPGNARSHAVATRLGFTHEGRLRAAVRVVGGYQDQDVYGLLGTDWPLPGATQPIEA